MFTLSGPERYVYTNGPVCVLVYSGVTQNIHMPDLTFGTLNNEFVHPPFAYRHSFR
jgi:hypothetical protein